MKRMMALSALLALAAVAAFGEPVKWRGIFINDEDWNLRPWAEKRFGASEGIGTNTYAIIYDMMKADGLNLIWSAMHEGGYEFSSRPENIAQAKEAGIWIGTSHCEPMLRNNCYIGEENKSKWDWLNHKDFVTDYWREGAKRGEDANVLWTLGMRGIHDAGMRQGTNMAHKIEIMQEVFKTQCSLLPPGAPKVFCPYKEVLPIYNAGLKVPVGTTILWVNDNFGYVRRLGGPQCNGYGQGIYWHVSYWGAPHSYLHLCTTPPAFMWYELVAKCANNGVRDLWMLNVGDVFQAEILMYCYGKFAQDPDYWMTRPDPQSEVLGMWVDECLARRRGGAENSEDSENNLCVSAALREKIIAHLNEYYNLGFIRKPEHMCTKWAEALPSTFKADLLARYHALLNEDIAIEKELAALCDSASHSRRLSGARPMGKRPSRAQASAERDTYFRAIGFQAQFLAHAGIIFLEGKGKDYALEHLDALNRRFDEIEGGKWAGFWWDTIDDPAPPHRSKGLACMHMNWPWNADRNRHDGALRGKYSATFYTPSRDFEMFPAGGTRLVASRPGTNGGAWRKVAGLGTSGNALALLPVKPGVGEDATLEYNLCASATLRETNLVIRFLPDFALWPGLGMKIGVKIGDQPEKVVEVPASDSNIGERDRTRQTAVQDNFIDVRVPLYKEEIERLNKLGDKRIVPITIRAIDPGVVIDKVGLEIETKQ